MIHVSAKVDQPEQVIVTMTISMTLGEWLSLADSLPRKYPEWKLGDAIKSAAYAVKRESFEKVSE